MSVGCLVLRVALLSVRVVRVPVTVTAVVAVVTVLVIGEVVSFAVANWGILTHCLFAVWVGFLPSTQPRRGEGQGLATVQHQEFEQPITGSEQSIAKSAYHSGKRSKSGG
jgi:hypothetical protein